MCKGLPACLPCPSVTLPAAASQALVPVTGLIPHRLLRDPEEIPELIFHLPSWVPFWSDVVLESFLLAFANLTFPLFPLVSLVQV